MPHDAKLGEGPTTATAPTAHSLAQTARAARSPSAQGHYPQNHVQQWAIEAMLQDRLAVVEGGAKYPLRRVQIFSHFRRIASPVR